MNYIKNIQRCYKGLRTPLISNSSHFKFLHSAIQTRQHEQINTRLEENTPDKLYKLVEMELRGHDTAVMASYTKFAMTAASHFDIESKCWKPRKAEHERFTLLKSAFVHKKVRVQYEFRTYYAFIHFFRLTGSTAETLIEYIQRNLPEGVALKTTMVELQALPLHLQSQQRNIDNERLSNSNQ